MSSEALQAIVNLAGDNNAVAKWLENRLMAIFIAALILEFFFTTKVELKKP